MTPEQEAGNPADAVANGVLRPSPGRACQLTTAATEFTRFQATPQVRPIAGNVVPNIPERTAAIVARLNAARPR